MKKRELMNKRMSSAVVTFGLLLSSAMVLGSPAIAQEAESVSTAYSGRIGFEPPADDPYPGSTRGGATRGDCQATSLMPRNGSGLTTRSRTSFYVHMARHPEATLSQALLMLKADDKSEHYEAFIDLPEDNLSQPGGILEIKLPESMPDLKVGKQYSWSLIMLCNEMLIKPDSPVVGGGVRRVAASLESTVPVGMTLSDKAIAYGEAGLWYDLLSTLLPVQSGAPEYEEFRSALKNILVEEGISEEVSEAAFIR